MGKEIYKAAGVIIRDKKLLVCRNHGKDFFISPGGKLESDETASQCLIRELDEELQVKVTESDLELIGAFESEAIGKVDTWIKMDVFMVHGWQGKISPSTEVEELIWIDSDEAKSIELGSIFKHDIVPLLKKKGLIA